MRLLKTILSLLLVLVVTLRFHPTTFASVSDTGFSDVSNDAWYAEAIKYCVENRLMSGTAEGIFSPDTSISRAMLATVLYRTAGSPQVTGITEFCDVAQGVWYTDAVTWAVQNEIMSGYSSYFFGTNAPVTHEQIATILWRYSGSPAEGEKTSNLFNPKENATRAEVASILWNYLNVVQSQVEPTPKTEPSMTNINITVGRFVFSAKLYNNSTTKALLEKFPMTLNMSELNNNEKFYYLSNRLPTESRQVGDIKNGDLMLYGSDCLVLFYKSFSTPYSYTELGYIDDPSGLAAALGSGSSKVTFAVGD